MPKLVAMKSRTVVRVAFVVIVTALLSIYNGADILLPWHPFSTYGFSATRDGRVTAADAVAQTHGLHAGDRILVKRLSADQRLAVSYLSQGSPGTTLRLPLASGRTVSVPVHVYKRSLIDNVSDVIAVFALAAYLCIAAILVLLRPAPATWAFFVFSLFFTFTGTLLREYISPAMQYALSFAFLTAESLAPAAFTSFALRFPNETPRGSAALLERMLLFVVTPLLLIWRLGQLTAGIFAGAAAPQWPQLAYQAITAFIYAIGVAALIGRYASAGPEDRNRLRWVVVTFAVAFLPLIVIDIIINGLSFFPEVSYINFAQAWAVIAPIALAYTVLKHRLFDLRFVVSRALVYALLTSLTIGLLALVDWALGRWLAESRFALIAELALAVFIGVGLTTAHRRIEAFLNGVIFRAQMLAMQALRRFAQETDLIGDPKHLLAQTYEALHKRLESEYAAIYTADGSSYALSTPGPECPSLLAGHDLAVLRLRRWHEPFECDEPDHPLRGALLLPMTARGELVGFIACGPKRDRTHYLPEEIDTLSLLAHRAGSAYALLTLSAGAVLQAQLT